MTRPHLLRPVLALLATGAWLTSCGSATDTATPEVGPLRRIDGSHLLIETTPDSVNGIAAYDSRAFDDATYAESAAGAPGLVPVDDQAGPVLVLGSDDDTPRSPDRVLVCAELMENASETLEYLAGPPVAGHPLGAKTTGGAACGLPDVSGVVWADGSWMVTAVAADGDVDRVVAATNGLTVTAEGSIVPGDDTAGLQEVGRLDDGWQLPPDHAYQSFTVERPRDVASDPGHFGTRTVLVTPQERGAIVARLADRAAEIASSASTPIYGEEYDDAQTRAVGERKFFTGAWGISTVASVEIPDDANSDSVAVIAGGSPGGEGSAALPPPEMLADMAARARYLDDDETQALIERQTADRLAAAYARADAEVDEQGISAADTAYGRAWTVFYRAAEAIYDDPEAPDQPPIRRTPGPISLSRRLVFAPGGRTSADTVFLELTERAVHAAATSIPSGRPATFEDPADLLPPEPSGTWEVVVLASTGIEVTIEGSDDVAVPMEEVTEVVMWTDGDSEQQVVENTWGEQWGTVLLEGIDYLEGLRVVGRRGGEVVFDEPLKNVRDLPWLMP